ncbi:MAG: hypothetical protein ACTTJJ_01045 [Prevotella fusca]
MSESKLAGRRVYRFDQILVEPSACQLATAPYGTISNVKKYMEERS